MTSKEICERICSLLEDKKAQDITVLDISHMTDIAEHFVIAGGTSVTQLNALAEWVEEKLEEQGLPPLRKDGIRDSRWIVYDYGGVILHLFLDDMRKLYSLDKLWSDGTNIRKRD